MCLERVCKLTQQWQECQSLMKLIQQSREQEQTNTHRLLSAKVQDHTYMYILYSCMVALKWPDINKASVIHNYVSVLRMVIVMPYG